MINILFSGIDKKKGFTEKQTEYLKKDIKSNSLISFIASDFNDYSKNDVIYNRMISFFKNIDISFKESYFIDSRSIDKIKNIITKSNIIFFIGGDPKQQMDYINEYRIKDYIDKSKIIIGVSAGAMNQSKKVIYKDKTI